MKRKLTASKPAPEQSMMRDEARAFASGVASHLSDQLDDSLSYFVLMLRWFAYQASDDDRETIYMQTEQEYAAHFKGVDEVLVKQMQTTLDAHRRRVGKGGM